MFYKKFLFSFLFLILSMSLFNIILSKRSVDINEIKNLESKFVNMRSYSLNRLNDFEIQSKIIENNPIPKIGLFVVSIPPSPHVSCLAD